MEDILPIRFAKSTSPQENMDVPTAWYRLNSQTPDLKVVLEKTIGLDPITSSSLTAEETRPRATPHGDGALVVLRAINAEFGAEPEDMVSLRMWIDGAKVVTFQRHRMPAVEEIAQEISSGQGAASPAEFLVQLADRMTDRMQEVVDKLDTDLEELEGEQSLKPVPELRYAITDLRRRAVTLRRFIAPQRDALDVLVDEDFTWQTETQDRRLKELVERITRIVEQLDTLHLRASILQDFLSVRVAERLNRTMLLLTVVASIFLPLSFIAGLLGMNVGGIPGSGTPTGFAYVAGVLVLVGLAELVVIWKLRLV